MLSVNKYPQDHVDVCRARVAAQVASFRKVVKQAKGTVATATENLEPEFYNNMVIVLDHYFVHRSRTLEGKDGNPVNEVRVTSNSLVENSGTMAADKTIKLDPSKSVLKLQVGDEIRITEAQFVALAKAFFAEIEKRFS